MQLLNPLTIAQANGLYPAKSFTATIPLGLSVGDCVYISGPRVGELYQVDRADPADILKMPAIGVLIAMAISGQGEVQCLGEMRGIYSSLSFPKPLFVSLAGRLEHSTPNPAPSGYSMVQVVGAAMSSDEVLLCPNFSMTKRIG